MERMKGRREEACDETQRQSLRERNHIMMQMTEGTIEYHHRDRYEYSRDTSRYRDDDNRHEYHRNYHASGRLVLHSSHHVVIKPCFFICSTFLQLCHTPPCPRQCLLPHPSRSSPSPHLIHYTTLLLPFPPPPIPGNSLTVCLSLSITIMKNSSSCQSPIVSMLFQEGDEGAKIQ